MTGPASAPSSITGLDLPHSKLLRALVQRRCWTRGEFEHEASKVSLLPDGALEVLNERALDHCDRPLFDGDDPMDVDVQIAQELIDA